MKKRGFIDPIPSILPFPSRPFVIGKPFFFSRPPPLHFIEKRLAITLEDVVYRNKQGYMRIVPAGLPFDGGSYPWPASLIWDRWNTRDLQAIILHDFTYAAYDSVRSWPIRRKEADRDMLDGFKLNEKTGGDRVRYLAVRFGAFGIWRRKSKCKYQRNYFEALVQGAEQFKFWVQKIMSKNRDR